MSADRNPKLNPTDGPVHAGFGGSYCNYLIVPRTFLQSMPIAWQEQWVALMEQLDNAFAHVPQAEVYDVHAATEHLVADLDGQGLRRAGIEVTAEGMSGTLRYWRDGSEVDGHERVLIRCADPVPHYNRGRTYIPPRTEGGGE